MLNCDERDGAAARSAPNAAGFGFALLLAMAVPVMAQQPTLVVTDPIVQQVLEVNRREVEALVSGRLLATQVSSTFVANTPGNGIVPGAELLAMFAAGSVAYASLEQQIEYAASHGKEIVVLMGIEVAVPAPGLANAGKRVHRRFTDVYRLEDGVWKHDLRHADVVKVEE
ncbi:MAG: nuclear transport factor 2 family protein [Gammaproteobacteria bacterium]|nr:nuclear transport factor 2 family protein [Gammaproteobacteria bacterium]